MYCYLMNKKIVLLFIFSLSTLLPNFSFALGFEQIKLYSYLNEPLDAEIELVGAEDHDLDHLIASLASIEDFKRAEMTRPYYLNLLRFEVKHDNKRTYIKVTSDEAVNQAFLEFLVDLTYSEGRLVRAYTLLLDPAPLSATKPVQKTQPEVSLTSKPTLYAKAEEEQALSDATTKQLETLFDTTDRQDIPVAPIVKLPAVSVEDKNYLTTGVMTSEEKQQHDEKLDQINVTEKNSESDVPTLDEKNILVLFFKNVRHHGMLWSSGLCLVMAVALTSWFFSRSDATVLLKSSAIPNTSVPSQEVVQSSVIANASGVARSEKQSRKSVPLHTSKTSDNEMSAIDYEEDEKSLKLKLVYQYLDIQDKVSAKEILDNLVEQGHLAPDEVGALLAKIDHNYTHS